MTFASLPDRRADLDPHGAALSDGIQSLTNAMLLQRVRAAAHHLDELGVGTGDVVALKLRNRVEFVVLMFASWRLGATVTLVNPNLTDVEVIRQLDASGARLLVAEDDATAERGVTTLAVADPFTDVAGGINHPDWTSPRWPSSSSPVGRRAYRRA